MSTGTVASHLSVNPVMDTDTVPDFSLLPDTVWVKVLTMLTIRDRYHLALTCSRLHGLFSVPEIWRIMTLIFYRPFSSRKKVTAILHRFGSFLQVEIVFTYICNLKALSINLEYGCVCVCARARARVCVCVCVCERERLRERERESAHNFCV